MVTPCIYDITFYEKNLHMAGQRLVSVLPRVRKTSDMMVFSRDNILFLWKLVH